MCVCICVRVCIGLWIFRDHGIAAEMTEIDFDTDFIYLFISFSGRK